jgi:hypothetical protein
MDSEKTSSHHHHLLSGLVQPFLVCGVSHKSDRVINVIGASLTCPPSQSLYRTFVMKCEEAEIPKLTQGSVTNKV